MMRALSKTLAIGAAVSAWLSFAAGPARAQTCPPTYAPFLELAWAEGGTGFVASRHAVVMVAMDGDCKHRYPVPAAELRVSAARKTSGPFEPVTIERRGKLFAWRPSAAGLWYLRVDRKTGGRPAPATAGAIVVAYEPEARVNARLILSLDGKLREGIALLPLAEPDERPPAERDCCTWLMPYQFVGRPPASGEISLRLPPGRYLARESFIDRRRRELMPLTTGQSGVLDVVSDGDVRLTMHAIERLPRPHAD